jgi:aminoglycoside 6'-N-acetyltransferase
MTPIRGERVTLRLATEADVARLVTIRSTPEVHARWGGADLEKDCRTAIASEELQFLAIEDEKGAVIGAIQWEAEEDPDYRHASVDIFLDPTAHGRGLCTETVRLLTRYLFTVGGHHRLTIDPAANNAAAIRCYAKAGFREIGTMRQYERGPDGAWHDGLLMELLADDLVE